VFVGVMVLAAIALGADLTRKAGVTGVELAISTAPPAVRAVVGLARRWRRRAITPVASLVLVAAMVAAGVGVIAGHAVTNVGVDVYLSHVAAADALADGENPYTDAVGIQRVAVRRAMTRAGGIQASVPAPWANAISTWLIADPRWLKVIFWIAVLCAVLWRVHRHRRALVVPFGLVLAVAPAWRLIVFTGCTAPLTIGLLVAVAFAWRRTGHRVRHPVGSGVGLETVHDLAGTAPAVASGPRRGAEGGHSGRDGSGDACPVRRRGLRTSRRPSRHQAALVRISTRHPEPPGLLDRLGSQGTSRWRWRPSSSCRRP